MEENKINIVDGYIEMGEILDEKIAGSAVFVVLASRNYIDGIKEDDKDIMEQKEVAKRLSRDTVVLVDKTLN